MPEQSKKALIVIVSILAALWAFPALARVSGPCANCHTMHNSQDGDVVARDMNDNPDATANRYLLTTDCVGCHSASDGSTWKDPVTGAPIVYNMAEPTYGQDAGDGKKQGLAAGNFYWVDQDDTFGHNIFSQDANLTVAPGGINGCKSWNACHTDLYSPITECSGNLAYYNRQYSCMKCHMLRTDFGPYHHSPDGGDTATNPGLFYRFLQGHRKRTGVVGIEDPDWQYTVSATDHNEYPGELVQNKTWDSGYFVDNSGKCMTAFCSGCHSEFHKQDDTAEGASPWFRHPSDQVLPATGEYAGYTEYDPLVPVARPPYPTAVSGVVTPGQDMVMCLSCHRAHGSPYPDMLRFPYSGMQAGGGGLDGVGCFKCHSGKDGS